MFKKMIEKLRDRTGASMLLVLAVMLLLLAVGGSALAAGSTAVGQVAAQKDAQQLQLYTYSINDTLLSALQKNTVDSLGAKLAMQLYQNGADGTLHPLPTKLDFAMDYTLPSDLDITMSLYCRPDVRITPHAPAVTVPQLDSNGNVTGTPVEVSPRQPRTALVDATVEVITVVELGSRKMTSAATFRLSDARLADDGVSETNMDFVLPQADNLGRWEMIRYEVLESN